MPSFLLKSILIASGLVGCGASGASIQLATQNFSVNNSNSNSDSDAITLDKTTLMKNMRFNLSSLNNHNDILGLSIKEDMQMAFASNYRQFSLSDIEMTFYYGNSTSYQIHFVDDNFRTILYFTAVFHSKTHAFEDARMTFDYRPTLIPFAKNFNGYRNTDIFLSKDLYSQQDANDTKGKFSNYKNSTDFLTDINNYVETPYVQNMFASQWDKMGINADRLNNYDKQQSLGFSNDFISYVSNLEWDMNLFDPAYFDSLPELLKVSTFKNLDSTLTFGHANYYKIESSVFRPTPDKSMHLSEFSHNYRNLELQDFIPNIKAAIEAKISEFTNYEINLSDSNVSVEFKVSYTDDADEIAQNAKVSDILSLGEIWVEVTNEKDTSPFLDLSDGPGFHIELD